MLLNTVEHCILYCKKYRPTYIISSTGLLRPDIFARPHQEVLVHCRLVRCRLVHCGLVRCRLKLVLRILFSDLIADVFSCVGRWKIVLFSCLGKGGCRQYRPSLLCISCIYRLLACMAVPFQGSSTLLYGMCCFLLVSKCVHLAIC